MNHNDSPTPRQHQRERVSQRVLAMIMAGGKGERLMPLTEQRSKPAVPFAGTYRITDFVLSNFLNSGILAMYVLVQYRSQSLIEHLRRAWRSGGPNRQSFITVVPPQMKGRGKWYEGTADAIYQNINLIRDFAPGLVAVFGADHIYRMDIRQMIQFHLDNQADVTVAALPVPLQAAKGFGIVEVDEEQRIIGFEEKPKSPKPMPSNPDMAYSSMGNYIFNVDTLIQALERDARESGTHDFGKDILPSLTHTHRVLAYDFMKNVVPGIHPYEEWGYWRDVGTIDAYWQANMDILGETPIFDLRNVNWPIQTDTSLEPVASLVRTRVDDAMVGQGSLVVDANITRSLIGRNVRIGEGSVIQECVILDGTIIGPKCRLRRVIADRFNVISAGTELGFGKSKNNMSNTVGKSGLIVLPRGQSYGGRAVIDPIDQT
ncbi:MAG: glucose-1-phosphate adenylyltransferase [Nitrospirales bacterium]|nr:MAG: glucose-1-phosphate adenylyltransferase [Nitrospirales bacterium]